MSVSAAAHSPIFPGCALAAGIGRRGEHGRGELVDGCESRPFWESRPWNHAADL
jgi:hypothetical protein